MPRMESMCISACMRLSVCKNIWHFLMFWIVITVHIILSNLKLSILSVWWGHGGLVCYPLEYIWIDVEFR